MNPTQVEPDAIRTGHPQGKRGVLIAVAITAAVLLLLFAIWSSPPDGQAVTSTVGQNETPHIDSYIPPPQKSFTYMIESFIPIYNSSDTEIRKTNVRFQRKDAIIQYFSRSGSLRFDGWVGEVHELATESDGKASFSVKLKGSDTVIQTWNNSFSDSPSHTMISRSDALYPSLMDIKNGDEVTVSGIFVVEGGGQDHIREASVTEVGSMTSPDFIVRFSQISKGARTLAQVPETSPPVPAANDRSASSPATETTTSNRTATDNATGTTTEIWTDPDRGQNTGGANADTNEVFTVGGDVSAPVGTYVPTPEYSQEGRDAKVQGTCVLNLIVGSDGEARDIKVTRQLGWGLCAKAVEAVSTWRFDPAMKDGHPVAVKVNVTVKFSL